MYLHQSAVLDYTYVADVFGVIVIACCQIPSVHVHISLSTFRSHREEKIPTAVPLVMRMIANHLSLFGKQSDLKWAQK